MGSLWPSESELFTNSVNPVVGVHETIEVRINWLDPPLDTATDEMRIQVFDSGNVLKYDDNHDAALVSISTSGWASGTYTIVSTLPGFEEVDTLAI